MDDSEFYKNIVTVLMRTQSDNDASCVIEQSLYIKELKHYKIKCGDILLNYKKEQYQTLKELMDDCNIIFHNYDLNDLLFLPQINTHISAKCLKERLPLLEVVVHNNISKILEKLSDNINNMIKTNISFDEIEYNLQN